MPSISNIVESFVPIMPDRNYAPTRTFVTKWDVEIENNRTKKISRRRERDTKYFDYFEESDALPLPVNHPIEELDCAWEIESDETQGWLRSIYAENAYYNRKQGELKDNFDWYDMNQDEVKSAPCKRNIDFDEYGMLKRIRA